MRDFVLSSAFVETAIAWLTDPPAWLAGINALIFLNFKPVTRDGNHSLLAHRHPRAREVFERASAGTQPFKVGFDDCSSTGILGYGDAHPASVEACDSARFSMFVPERMRAYPCSFMAELCEGHAVTDGNLLDVWRHGELFVRMRQSLVAGRCSNCERTGSCLSGCPLFPEINFCEADRAASPVVKSMRADPHPPAVELTVNGSRAKHTQLARP